MKRQGTTLDDIAEAIVDLGTMIGGQINGIHGQLGGLRNDVDALKKDVGILNGDVRTLKDDVCTLKNDVCALKNDVRDIKHELRGHGQRIGGLEGEMQATRNDIKELYSLVAT